MGESLALAEGEREGIVGSQWGGKAPAVMMAAGRCPPPLPAAEASPGGLLKPRTSPIRTKRRMDTFSPAFKGKHSA